MLLGVVSDTHGRLPNTTRAVRMLDSLDVAEVIHCGDIGSSEIVAMFSAWPTHFVFGNVDYDREALQDEIARAGQTCCGEFGSFRREDREIAFLHGDDCGRLTETIRGGRFALVCHGHTHVSRIERLGETLVLNPGAVFRARPHSIAVVELPTLQATIISLD
jgi:putative phosphoesterase